MPRVERRGSLIIRSTVHCVEPGPPFNVVCKVEALQSMERTLRAARSVARTAESKLTLAASNTDRATTRVTIGLTEAVSTIILVA